MEPILIGIIVFCAAMIPIAFFTTRDSAKLERNRDTPIESAVVGLSEGKAISLAERFGYKVRVCTSNSMFSSEYDGQRLNIQNQDGHVAVAWIG